MHDAHTRFKEIWHKIDIHYNRYARKMGINFTAMLVLELLCSAQASYTQTALCEQLALPKQIVNAIINTFREQGYVELREARDRRNKEIRLTEKGKSYALEISKPLDSADESAWKDFTDEEAAIFMRALEKYERALAERL
ncbi:MAG: MarR family transcriptional regulator [Defluviitaleaceae bacterium]|nr:MarR family transcriptional regulator [Defluviitaleaceae bacterium]MCL2274529.1 MarR family transcriptional regulator [Defluviitaleaceae bacterium]